MEVAVVELEYGDVCFTGNGPAGECMVGCERKRLSDLVNSMRDRRLSGHQLRGMARAYDFSFLFAEFIARPGPNGEIEELGGRDWRPFYSVGAGRSAVAYRQLSAYLTSLELCGSVVVRRTSNARETAAQYVALWHWFQKEWEDHHSHDQIYTGTPKKGHGGKWARPHAHNEEFNAGGRTGALGKVVQDTDNPSTLWRMASQLPGVDRRAYNVANHFSTVFDMTLAGLPDELKQAVVDWYLAHPGAAELAWREIDGVGPAIAAAAVRAIREEGA